ncbi:MAG TPA: peptidoglycan-binding protein [Marinospirillum sp.]|uniref:peptidoglycan-binding protein n=1 Tax=Marinospirillum sp. TaxID=2183934 RepID=UPI002B46427C|nr:peptidoglycan-binding protein [Marinospirillum sp.]HKM15153.1 peptidoglycan-binding protein [Marinospirillum sp.]
MVWDTDSTKKVKKISDSEYQSVLDSYLKANTLKTQQLLNKLGYYLNDLDGNYGPPTAHAIKSYQRDNLKIQDGKVSNNLIIALEKSYQQYLKELKNNKNLTVENYNTGFEAAKSGNYEKAARLYKLSADQGYASAQVNLGVLYRYGQGVKQDYYEATRLFKLSADQGYARAQVNLGLMYYHGQGVKQNYQEAARLYKLSADQGYASAQVSLGWMYRYGEGVKQDYQEAARLYKLSADQGDATAQFNLGWMYRYGQGVKQNNQEAARLYKLSADQGHADAKNNLEFLCKAQPSVCR